MSFVSARLTNAASAATAVGPAGAASPLPLKQHPRWWRVPMVWVVIAGPLSVVIASLLTAVIAWRHIDPVIVDAGDGHVIGRAGDDAITTADPKDPLAPAVKARNHSATSRGGAP